MPKTNKLLDLLKAKCGELKWYGWEKKSCLLGQHGAFITYNTQVRGFEVRITSHKYSRDDFPGGPPERVRWRRKGLLRNSREWIEISISDEAARFGRRSILDKKVFLPGTPEHEEVKGIFEHAERIGTMFTPQTADRLSSDEAVSAFCDVMNVSGPL